MAENQTYIPLANVRMEFSLKDTPIDYFQLSPSILNPSENDIILNPEDYIDLDLDADEYLSVNHLEIDHDKKETIVFNLPVGKGKTEVCYELIRKYHADGYYVIICSPFIKLVEKDKRELSRYYQTHEIFTYTDIEDSKEDYRVSLNWGVEARILIMTTNMLLQNPGENFYEQKYTKRYYLNYLEEIIKSRKKKIVFFFDEIHRAVEEFKRELLPNLYRWLPHTHKCYISSATFTPASIPVIRYISSLTDFSTKVFFTSRLKRTIQANLHLHISTETYSGAFPYTLKKINSLVHNYKGRKINILSGYETIVEALAGTRKPISLFKPIRDLNANICTGNTKTLFDKDNHNIGTNFGTGVNIKDEDGVLIIIIPPIRKIGDQYGVFTDGIPSIVQSVARLRNGGDVHIFMYAPNAIIDLENHKDNIDEKLYNEKSNVPYLSLNDGYINFVRMYERKYNRLEFGRLMLSTFDEHELLKYQYPTLQEELITISQDLLVKGNESQGKGLSPYILWAAINNQFINATLRTMELITKDYQQIVLTSENIYTTLLNLLTNTQKLTLRGLEFKTAYKSIINYIQREDRLITNEDGENELITILNKFTYNGTSMNIEKLIRSSSFNQVLMNILCFLKTGIERNITKENYIHTCIANAINYNGEEMSELLAAYNRLGRLKDEFIQFIQDKSIENKSKEKVIHQDRYLEVSETFISQCIEVIILIKKKDKFLDSDTLYSFFQGITINSTITVGTKKAVWLEFKKLFTSIGEDRRTYNGEKKYYLIPEIIITDSAIAGVNFI